MALNQSSTLLGRVREVIRYKHYSIRTERCYVEWVRRFVAFHGRRHPRAMGTDEVRAFLGHLAADLRVAASTHQQALSALLFLYREVLGIDLPWLSSIAAGAAWYRRWMRCTEKLFTFFCMACFASAKPAFNPSRPPLVRGGEHQGQLGPLSLP